VRKQPNDNHLLKIMKYIREMSIFLHLKMHFYPNGLLVFDSGPNTVNFKEKYVFVMFNHDTALLLGA